MRVITGARPFIDIDAYGGILAYAELLQKQGIPAVAASSSVINGSVTPSILAWGAPLRKDYKPGTDDTFTLIDVANPDFLDTMVEITRVDEIIDHHPGYDDFWIAKLGDNANLEMVGAACTLVYERWAKSGKLSEMSQTSARTLVCGILDNTLNFGAKLTGQRDKDAYAALSPIANLAEDWVSSYFSECQADILKDLPMAINNDYKPTIMPGWNKPAAAGQLQIWDAAALLQNHLPEIKSVMRKSEMQWFMNIIAISEGKSYFVSDDPVMQKWLSDVLGLKFEDDIATANRMWLRKEMVKEALNKLEAKV